MPLPKDNIKHLIVVMLENRSFDHMFGYLTIDNPNLPGDSIDNLGDGGWSNPDSSGKDVFVSMDARYAGDYRVDPGHHFPDVTQQIFEKDEVPSTARPTMDGFVKNYEQQPGGSRKASAWVMRCFDPEKLPALTSLAKEFAVCDRWFASVPGPTLPNRAFAHAATSLGHVDMSPIAYWNIRTLYEQLGDQGVSSKVYSHDGNSLAFMFKSLFKKGGKLLGSYNDFKSDLKGKLPQYSFIEPRFNDWYDESNHRYYVANDQHPDNNVAEGELFIQDLYQSIRKSKYWDKCLFVIVYDEHGGFFDHVKPPQTIPSGQEKDGISTFDFRRLGVRVPAVLISPYIARGTILHDELEHSSLAATAREILAPNMPPLTERDKNANTFTKALTLSAPRQDTPEKLDMTVKGAKLRTSDVDTNTHGTATLSDQQRNQVLAVYMRDLDRPSKEREIGNGEFKVLEDINTEQKAATYIKAVATSLGIT